MEAAFSRIRSFARSIKLSMTGTYFAIANKVSCHEQMYWRMVFPVSHKIVEFPQSQLLDLMKGPSGSGCDVAENKWPVNYTGTGVGSPATAFFRPETSSTVLKSVLKSSKVSPFSSWSVVRS